VFSDGGGIIYAIKPNGDMDWYRHDGRGDGTDNWTGPSLVGGGLDSYCRAGRRRFERYVSRLFLVS
jgi:hypothetical protein